MNAALRHIVIGICASLILSLSSGCTLIEDVFQIRDKQPDYLPFFLLLSLGSGGPIIADHTVVDRYNAIPDSYLNLVKSRLVDIAGESHSSGYRIGMDLLAAQPGNSRFAVQIFDGSIPPVTDQNLRIGRHGSVGEEDFYTNAAALVAIKGVLDTQSAADNPIHVLGFGWCWDMTWHNDVGGVEDPIYHVHWAGSSVSGPEGDLRWGLDSGDEILTGNSVSMNTYLAAVEEYNQHCRDGNLDCTVIYTTGPVDGSENVGERGYQRWLKHEHIRQYVRADSRRILFDYGDILSHNDSGERNEISWTDSSSDNHLFQAIHPDNMLDLSGSYAEDGDHIGEVGAVRLAKAMWWLLARLEGWNG